jgi:Icc-related predicted phosphoesterase
MKLLAFSDLHRDQDRAERLVELAREADVVLGAGDFATMHKGLDGMIGVLSAIAAPAVLVPGNAETDTELWQACAGWKSAHVLHGQALQLEGAQFFGLGGGVPPTPFPWSFDLSEREADEKLNGCPEGCVLVVHSPPKGYVDESHGRHMGSDAILTAIETKRPRLAVCGHIHDSWGQEATIGRTPVVNLGPEGRFFEL